MVVCLIVGFLPRQMNLLSKVLRYFKVLCWGSITLNTYNIFDIAKDLTISARP